MSSVVRNRKNLGKDTFLCFVDFKKAFDSVNRNLLLYKLSSIGITGSMYKAISSLYSNPKSRVLLRELQTDYFECPMGVKQGDNLSPTLFAIFVNDLADEIKNSKIGIEIEVEDLAGNIERSVLNILLYADDIVLFSQNEEDMQSLLCIVQSWCESWRLEVNLAKTNIMHVRPKRKPSSNFMFLFNRRPVPYCTFYKYLGCNFNEHWDYQFTADMQCDSAGRALSSITTKMLKNGGFPFVVFSKLVHSCVYSISQYGSEIFGYDQFKSAFKLHLRAARTYLGMPKNVTSYGLLSELNWLLPHYQSQIKMVQYFGRLMSTSSNRLMYMIYKWDRRMNDTGQVKSWSYEVQSILEEHGLGHIFENQQIFPVKTIISQLKESMIKKQSILFKTECLMKPKLRTFLTFKDFETLPPHISKPLSFVERRTVSKFRLGIFPIRLETARYLRPIVPENERVCYCNSGDVESEYHVVFICSKYDDLRDDWISQLTIPINFNELSAAERFKLVLNEPGNIKPTARFLVALMDKRRLLNNFN